MMVTAVYVRTSKTMQVLENQLLPLRQYAERAGWEYKVFEEQESTRKTRPVQWALYNDLLKKKYDRLFIYKFDRWARSTKELLEHIETLHDKGIVIHSYTENIDINTSMGRAMLTIIGAFAQLERDLIRERTLAGLERARAQGKKLGRPSKGNYKKPSREDVSCLMSEGKSIREMAKCLGTSKYWVETVTKEIRALSEKDRAL